MMFGILLKVLVILLTQIVATLIPPMDETTSVHPRLYANSITHLANIDDSKVVVPEQLPELQHLPPTNGVQYVQGLIVVTGNE